MRALFAAFALPFAQLLDPAFRGPLLKGLGGAALAFAGTAALAGWGVQWIAGGEGWFAAAAGLLGGVLVLFAAIWLFVPAALAIAGLFSDETAAAVERRYYPGLPPAEGATLAAQTRFNLTLAAKVLGLNLMVLPVALVVPLFGALALWAIAAFALGDGMFEGVAQRRMSVAEARELRRARRAEVLPVGAALAALALVPIANLLVPVLGTAAMTHLLHRGAAGPVARGSLGHPPAGRVGGATA